MTILTKEADLLKFINEKKQDNFQTSQKILYNHYIKIIISSLLNCYNKIIEPGLTIKCVDTIYILFWFLIEYSKNIKLSSFLCDRAILLYTEYILMISSPAVINKITSDIDITEVKTFVYKKTIGPLKPNSIKKKKYDNNYYKFCYIIKEIYSLLFYKIEQSQTETGNIDIVKNEFNKAQVCLNNYINDEIFNNDSLHDVNLDLLESFLSETQLVESLNYIDFFNLIVILMISSKLYKISSTKYIEKIIFLVNEKYHKEIKIIVNKNRV